MNVCLATCSCVLNVTIVNVSIDTRGMPIISDNIDSPFSAYGEVRIARRTA